MQPECGQVIEHGHPSHLSVPFLGPAFSEMRCFRVLALLTEGLLADNRTHAPPLLYFEIGTCCSPCATALVLPKALFEYIAPLCAGGDTPCKHLNFREEADAKTMSTSYAASPIWDRKDLRACTQNEVTRYHDGIADFQKKKHCVHLVMTKHAMLASMARSCRSCMCIQCCKLRAYQHGTACSDVIAVQAL